MVEQGDVVLRLSQQHGLALAGRLQHVRGLRVAAEELAQAQDDGAASLGREVDRGAHLADAGAESAVPDREGLVLADPLRAVVGVQERRGLLDQLAHTGPARGLGDRDGGLEVQAVVLAPGQGPHGGHVHGHVGEGVDDDVVAGEGPREIVHVEHVRDDAAPAAALDDRDAAIAAGHAGDLVAGLGERGDGLLAEHARGARDRDLHPSVLLVGDGVDHAAAGCGRAMTSEVRV